MTTPNINYIKYILYYFVVVAIGLVCIWIIAHIMAVMSFIVFVLLIAIYVISPDLTTKILKIFKIIRPDQSINLKNILKISSGFLIFGLICVGMVIIEAKLFFNFKLSTFSVNEVSVMVPQHGQYIVGQIFPFQVDIGSSKVAINAVQADLGFDPSILKVVDISDTNSFATVYLEKTVNNEAGFIRISGGMPNPGVKDGGNFATINFIALKKGPAKIQFLPSSMILQNDGYGTNVLKKYPVATYYFADVASSSGKDIVNSNGNVVSFSLDSNALNKEGQIEEVTSNGRKVLGLQDHDDTKVFDSSYDNQNKFMQMLEAVDIWILDLCKKIFMFIAKLLRIV